jgi:signal transduction histidine kinase
MKRICAGANSSAPEGTASAPIHTVGSQVPSAFWYSVTVPSRAPAMQHSESDLSQLIAQSDTPQTALLQLISALGETFQPDACLIKLWGNDRSPLQTVGWALGRAAISSAFAWVLAHPAIESELGKSDLLAIADCEMQPDSHHPDSPSGGIRAALLSKTWFQGRNNGVMVLLRSQPYVWTEVEMQQLKVWSETIAVAIAQVQLAEQLQRQMEYQSLIDRLSEAVGTAEELGSIFQLVLEHTLAALRVSRGLVLLLKHTEPLKNRMRQLPTARITVAWEAAAKPRDPLPSEQAFWLSECCLCQQVYATKALLVISDVSKSSAIAAEQKAAAVFHWQTFPALLLVPLIQQETVLGYLALQHDQPCGWQPEECAFVKLVATQLSTAIVQTQTLRQVHALVEERTAQLQRSLEVQAKLYEKTRQQIEQLRHLNQLKDEFLSNLSHELLTPLTSMALAIRMLKQAELSPERRTTYLDILEQQCAQETNLINDLLSMQKLDARSTALQLQKIDVKFLIHDLVQAFEENWTKQNLLLAIDLPEQPVMIDTNLDCLRRIFTELLTNAGKYAAANSTIHLKLTQTGAAQSQQVVITLCNFGAAILPEELPHIYDRFQRGQGVTQRAIPGTGLGLALVKALVEHLHGTIAATSHPSEQGEWETCFTLTLPQFLSFDA